MAFLCCRPGSLGWSSAWRASQEASRARHKDELGSGTGAPAQDVAGALEAGGDVNAPPVVGEVLGRPARDRAGTGETEGSLFDEADEQLDMVQDSPSWAANYRPNDFSFWSLLPPSLWMPAYVRTVLGRATEEDVAGAGKLPYSLKGDTIAGLTVGVMLVPQCLAFAMLAGLPVQAGLFSSFMPLIMYFLFGTIRQVQPGPTAVVSLLTGQALDSMMLTDGAARMEAASALALLVGCASLLLGVVRFGFIVDLMSHSVMTAFCTASGVTIATSQLKHMLGIKIARQHYWWETVYQLASNLDQIDIPTLCLGGTILATLMFLKKWKQAGSAEKRSKHPLWKRLPGTPSSCAFRALKFVADLSSLFAVVIGSLWCWAYRLCGIDSVAIVGAVETQGFVVDLPRFPEGGSSLFLAAAVIAIVGFLETVAVGGKFAAKAQYDYEPNQELLALGFANVAGGLMSGYPVTGSFTRTAVNAMFGATSLVSCAISSSLVLMAVYVLLPVIAWLPMASLAPIIIQGAFGVIDVHGFRVAYRATAQEFLVMFATLSVSLALSVKEGLLVGFVLSVLKTINDLAHPNLAVCGRLPDGSFRDVRNFAQATPVPLAVVVRMDARLNFANARKLKEFCLKAVGVREEQGDRIEFVVIDAKSFNHVDLTGCEALETLAELLRDRNQQLIIANIKGPVSKSLSQANVPETLKRFHGHVCIDMEQALAIVAQDARAGNIAQKNLRGLVKRVDAAQQTLKRNQSSGSCSLVGLRSP